MLAYESIERCREDLLKYKLIIQSVPVVSSTSNSDSAGFLSNFSLNSSPSIKKLLDKPETPIPNSTNNTSQTFEEVLDCKSCTLQGF